MKKWDYFLPLNNLQFEADKFSAQIGDRGMNLGLRGDRGYH